MSQKKAIGCVWHWLPTAVIFLCTIIPIFCSSCLSHASRPSAAPQNAVPSSHAKLRLNIKDEGTIDDTSTLEKDLSDLFDQRAKNSEPERSVYIKAEDSLKVAEVAKVVAAIRKVEVGATPKLFVEVAPAKRNDPLELLVRVGNVVAPKGKASHIGNLETEEPRVLRGLALIADMDIILKHSKLDDIPKGSIAVELPKDGEYLVNLGPVSSRDLADELQTRVKEIPQGGRDVTVEVFVARDVSYGSLAELANAAYKAGAASLHLATLVP